MVCVVCGVVCVLCVVCVVCCVCAEGVHCAHTHARVHYAEDDVTNLEKQAPLHCCPLGLTVSVAATLFCFLDDRKAEVETKGNQRTDASHHTGNYPN